MERMTHGSTLSLDCGDSSVLLLPAMHGHWFELAQRKQTLIQLRLRARFWVIVAYVRWAEIDDQGKFESVSTSIPLMRYVDDFFAADRFVLSSSAACVIVGFARPEVIEHAMNCVARLIRLLWVAMQWRSRNWNVE